MNYKELLSKYIEHVCDCEGTDFLSSNYGTFTEEEYEALIEASGVSLEQRNRPASRPLTRSPEYSEEMRKVLLEHLTGVPSSPIASPSL